ncbi:MAG: stage V sporulation protein AD [Clostridiales bacterium]|nr:stage V sporulation protein AD [Clostridiales bacterium]MCD8133060.1 stage V sporulation protein AD [Clostridiales bacterium]
MSEQIGKQSLRFSDPPYIVSSSSVVGTKEGEGPLGKLFDVIGEDDTFGSDNWEAAESALQKKAMELVIDKAGICPEDIRYLFAGDLLGQSVASSFALQSFGIPLFGLYGACSTAGLALSLAAMTVSAGYADLAAAVTSSHFASAEKQFRFPLEYANQRPLSTTWTVTGSGAFLLAGKRKLEELTGRNSPEKIYVEDQSEPAGTQWTREYRVKISGVTTGKILDYGVRDSMNMGAAMAPAAKDVIEAHLKDFGRSAGDYDKIITGDLGGIGREILIDLLREKNIDIAGNHTDCGLEIFDNEKQGTGSGGSGCGCSAVTLSAHFLPMLRSGKLKRILFVPTGALLSKISFNEGENVPGIAHAVVLESDRE